MKQPALLQLVWRDTASNQTGWTHKRKVKPDERVVVTVGWLAHETELSYVLAQDWDGALGNFNGLATYPKGCVDEVTKLA